ncbi:MAG: nucleotidyltransferase substrate binding protein [Oligoflexia bacterium]|nr:nucleotidyltransferase substrate binding protein [Oligoflexia bacterium]
MNSSNICFNRLLKAIESLEKAVIPPPLNDRERDGAIQRFEYTFELAWKTAKKVLFVHGIVVNSPNATIRELAVQGWIESSEKWMKFLNARNSTSHMYSEELASEIYEQIKFFLPEVQKLAKLLQDHS